MKERPIPFSAPMVRAVLAGTKTQTRRPFKMFSPCMPEFNEDTGLWEVFNGDEAVAALRCPYGVPGDRLWVREAWRARAQFDALRPSELFPQGVRYEATADPGRAGEWGRLRPGMFMPRWASRITLEVTGVRVERLQGIGDADAIAEGIERGQDFPGWYRGPLAGDSPELQKLGFKIPTAFPRVAYCALWESINGPGSWAANPWVWVLSFRKTASGSSNNARSDRPKQIGEQEGTT